MVLVLTYQEILRLALHIYQIRLYKLWVGLLLYSDGTCRLRARSSHALLFIQICTAVSCVAPITNECAALRA